MFKKKYLGGLKLSLLLLFIMLLSMSSTCYARTTLTDDEVEYLVNNFFYFDNVDFTNTYYSDQTYTSFNLNTLQKNDTITFFKQVFNNNNTINFNDRLTDFFAINTYWYENSSRIFHGSVIVGQANFGLNGSLPHLKLLFNSNTNVTNKTYHWWYFFVDDNMTTISQNVQYFDYLYNLNNSTFTFYQRRVLSSPTIEPSAHFVSKFNSAWNLNNNNNSTINPIAGLVTFYNTQSVYTNFDGSNYYNSPVSKLLKTGYTGNINEPENPDYPTEPGNTGTITNPSGETTGNIDLSGITNSLDNIENKIPTSGDIQGIISGETGRVVNAINNANENYWGGSGDLTGDDEQEQIKDSLNDIIDSVSGELTSNAVFGHLEQAEDIFLGFFKNKEDESYYDLIISWDTISPVFTMFNGTQNIASGFIISGDSLNISALCRENQELAKIQQYIRIIFNFSVFMALIWQIYNLILSTLGIDNPYLYEDAQVNDVVNTDTGEVKSYYRTRKRVFWRR